MAELTDSQRVVRDAMLAARSPITADGIALRTGLTPEAVRGVLGSLGKRVTSEQMPCDRCEGAGHWTVWTVR